MMKAFANKKLAVGLVTVAIIALGATAYAYKGMGSQHGGKGCGGCENYQKNGGCGKTAMNENLTAEQREQLDAERSAFIDATKEERQALADKKAALWDEIAKENPNVQTASALQQEISRLRAGYDQKLLNHIIAVRKINPDAGKRYMMKSGGGYGKGHGMGNRSGDCPYQE